MMENGLTIKRLTADVLIIGGGTAGCYAAITIGRRSGRSVLIAEKADIRRSGCLAAGVNALNAYLSDGHTPEDYLEYARKDAESIIRDDLVLSLAERVNAVTEDLERLGLVILKDQEGNYVTRGWRNVKINGENIKPLLAQEVSRQKNVTVINHINITDLKQSGDGRVCGAYGFSVREKIAYEIRASAVLIASGGASGLYRPNNPGFSRHKMWYPPFNTGGGYAMGIRAGAEMTTLENRFVALRCKDTIAPTGTIAQGVHAPQINASGEVYEKKYGLTTPLRIYGTVEECRNGRDPCYLATAGISRKAEDELFKAYLNMAPMQTLKWLESGKGPSEENVEIDGTEPYVTGGHTASGFWVDTGRRTTLKGLYAAGDAAGGAPQKYVTGALAEGQIAAETILQDLQTEEIEGRKNTDSCAENETSPFRQYREYLDGGSFPVTCTQTEEAMQKIMDEYAGGIRTDYRYHRAGLLLADQRIRSLENLCKRLRASDTFELLHIYELRERLTVCRALIAHLLARKETRWHIFGENTDYANPDSRFDCYVNSVYRNGEFQMLCRPLVHDKGYSHTQEKILQPEVKE